MVIQKIEYNFSVCKLSDWSAIDLTQKFYFLSKTDEEMSLVCITDNVPDTTVQREDG